MERSFDLITLTQNTSILRWTRIADFADINKIEIIFMKTTFKDSKKVKRIRKYVLKCNQYLDLL